MTKKLALLAVIVLLTTGTSRAQGLDVIEIRQDGQSLLAGTFGAIRAVVAAKGDVKSVESPARSMARWIQHFPALFPPGSDKGHDTKALPAIWTDKAGFQKAADDMAAASIKLADFAKAGDAEGVATQVKAVGDTCGACHRTFKAR